MFKPDQVNWLLMGTSDIACKRVAPALATLKTGRLVGVCGSDQKRVDDLADAHGAAERYTSLDEALANTAANAVYIATPVYRHTPEALKAMDAGMHVLIEKPLALSAADAAPVLEKARATGLRAGCAFYRRTFDRYIHLREMIEAGTFGQVVLVRTSYWSWFGPAADDPKRWRVSKDKAGGGPLSDLGSHMFDLIIGLFDLPRSVVARVKTLTHDYEVEDSSAVIMELRSGAPVLACFCWNSKTWTHEFEVVGTEAKVRWYPSDTGKVLITVGRDVQELDMPNADNVHAPLVEDFAHAVIGGRDPIVPVAEAAKTNVLLDAIYESGLTGREIML